MGDLREKEEIKEDLKRGGVKVIEAFEKLINMWRNGKRIIVVDSNGEKYELVGYEWEYEPDVIPTWVVPIYYLKLRRVNGSDLFYKWVPLGELQYWLLEGGDLKIL